MSSKCLTISQLNLPYLVDEEKGNAKFDKSKKVLTVTLPVLPPSKTCPHQPPAQDDAEEEIAVPSPEVGEYANVTTVKTDKVVEENGNLQNERKSECNSTDDSQPSSGNPVTSDDSTKQEPVVDSTPQTLQEDWTSTGEWVCPPFTYRQDDTIIAYCLHTANAKEKSLVKYFDEHFVSPDRYFQWSLQ